MRRLTVKEVRTLSIFLRDLYQLRTHDQFTTHLISALPTVTEGEFTSYNEFVAEDQTVTYKSDQLPYCPDPIHYAEVLQQNLHEHRLVNHFLNTKEKSAHTFSDFSSIRQFRTTVLYNEFYKPLKMSYLLFMGLRVNKRMLSISRHRNDKEFSDSAKALFNAIHPHIQQALTNALTVTQMQNELDVFHKSIEGLARAKISVTERGGIRFSSPNARALLKDYGLQTQPGDHWLPVRLRDWVVYHKKLMERSDDVPLAIQPLIIEGDSGHLSIRLIAQGPHYDLILEEYRTVPSLVALKELGLSVRESEILGWVARGKTNPEIGLILNISRRTVHKHLEHIYVKLGAENRMAAVGIAVNAVRFYSYEDRRAGGA
ncbi:response regulator transcription factor [Nitrospira defluvii]|uniref:HTH luxR-type domain-containing protein n=1 Tax=Nitrospira defluvii TaxID=330214 RepID=A0ABN7LJC5_9BACT|nr:helix-turn-helix transcriptional regulator [Nitrospira defluvii]CAE6753382.1 HTH luxR-type domain-containing protein [Nitrospira defluvii]